jgi:hypothetical protein
MLIKQATVTDHAASCMLMMDLWWSMTTFFSGLFFSNSIISAAKRYMAPQQKLARRLCYQELF